VQTFFDHFYTEFIDFVLFFNSICEIVLYIVMFTFQCGAFNALWSINFYLKLSKKTV